MSLSQFSFDIKPDIFYNVQIRRMCWPGNRFQIVFSLVFLRHPRSMDWGIIIMEKILFSGKCLAITGQMLSSEIVLYFSELIFPVIHVNVPTRTNKYTPISSHGTKSGLYPSPRLRQIYPVVGTYNNLTFIRKYHFIPISIHNPPSLLLTPRQLFLLFSALTTTFFFITLS